MKKPSEWIKERAKELAAKEVLEENPYMAWESRESLTSLKLTANGSAYILLAIVDWLDNNAQRGDEG